MRFFLLNLIYIRQYFVITEKKSEIVIYYLRNDAEIQGVLKGTKCF